MFTASELMGMMVMVGAVVGVAVTAVLVGAIILDVIRHGRRK